MRSTGAAAPPSGALLPLVLVPAGSHVGADGVFGGDRDGDDSGGDGTAPSCAAAIVQWLLRAGGGDVCV